MAMLLALAACATSPGLRIRQSDFNALEARFNSHIATLASEEFAGRRPGTEGEDKTLAYLRSEFERIGLVSGTNDPAHPWNAPVLLASVASGDSRIELQVGRRRVELAAAQTFALTPRRRGLVERGEMVFVGFADAEIPEEAVRGRVALMLAEPGLSAARRAKLFEAGPAAVLTIVADAGSIEQMRSFASEERLVLASEAGTELEAFASTEAIAGALGEKRWQGLREAAEAGRAGAGFEPTLLDARITIEATAQRREVPSHNLIGRLPGRNPNAGAILLLAHWDHFGTCGPDDAADRLCNGAVDNASGLALMIELTRRLAKGKPLERDVYVLATTAEEWGLLGARAFAEEPPIPLDNFIAAFNFDTVAIGPRGSPVGFIGEGRTPLDAVIKQAIADMRREMAPRERVEPFLQRQDGWALLQRDVPAVVISNAFGDEALLNGYLGGDYHQASDNPGPLQLGGAIDDLLLHELLVRRLADPKQYP
ncbi:MAG: M28 family peptidase [Erythrobacter sp.]